MKLWYSRKRNGGFDLLSVLKRTAPWKEIERGDQRHEEVTRSVRLRENLDGLLRGETSAETESVDCPLNGFVRGVAPTYEKHWSAAAHWSRVFQTATHNP